MPVMDEFKEQREALKNGTPKEKLSYFVYYYKWHVIAGVLAVAAVVSIAYEILTQKDTAFYACLLNSVELPSAEEYNAKFTEYAGIDTDTYDVIFDANLHINPDNIDESTMANSQKLMAYLAAADLDVMITDADSILTYAYQEDFTHLEELLSPEQYEAYSPYFYYIDLKAVEEWNAVLDNPDNMFTDYSYDFPDPRKPEEMESPVVVGIYLDSCDAIRESYHFKSDDVVYAVFANTTRSEMALRYLDYLMQ